MAYRHAVQFTEIHAALVFVPSRGALLKCVAAWKAALKMAALTYLAQVVLDDGTVRAKQGQTTPHKESITAKESSMGGF